MGCRAHAVEGEGRRESEREGKWRAGREPPISSSPNPGSSSSTSPSGWFAAGDVTLSAPIAWSRCVCSCVGVSACTGEKHVPPRLIHIHHAKHHPGVVLSHFSSLKRWSLSLPCTSPPNAFIENTWVVASSGTAAGSGTPCSRIICGRMRVPHEDQACADVSQQHAQNIQHEPQSSERVQRHSPAKTCRPLGLQARAVAGRMRRMLVLLGRRQRTARPQQPPRGGFLLSKNFAGTPLP